MIKGCDVASYQQQIDFDTLKASGQVDFMIIKATEGVGFTDPMFPRNWSEAGRVGLRRGLYHFARPDLGNSAMDEAIWFLSKLGPNLPTDGTMYGLDFEVDWDGDIVGWCLAWLTQVKATTQVPSYMYLNQSYFKPMKMRNGSYRTLDWTPVVAAGYPLWLASYDGSPTALPQTPWPTVAMKQWTSSGKLAGISGNVDLNALFDGGNTVDYTQFKTWFLQAYSEVGVAALFDQLKVLIGKLSAGEAVEQAEIVDLENRLKAIGANLNPTPLP